jgi:hypothetical protein
VLIPEGQSSVTVTVTPMLDGLAEANETVVLTLTAGTYVSGAADTATVTITENTPTVTVAATDAAADEAGPDPGNGDRGAVAREHGRRQLTAVTGREAQPGGAGHRPPDPARRPSL